MDIPFSAYLAITGLKEITKEDELADLKTQMVNQLGCQKGSLTPLLESFLKFASDFDKQKFENVGQVRSAVMFFNEVLNERLNPIKTSNNPFQNDDNGVRVLKLHDLALAYLKKSKE